MRKLHGFMKLTRTRTALVLMHRGASLVWQLNKRGENFFFFFGGKETLRSHYKNVVTSSVSHTAHSPSCDHEHTGEPIGKLDALLGRKKMTSWTQATGAGIVLWEPGRFLRTGVSFGSEKKKKWHQRQRCAQDVETIIWYMEIIWTDE